MDRVSRYLEVVPLPVILLAPVIAIFGFLLIPRYVRFDFSLAFLGFWLVINRLVDLGPIYSIAKVTAFSVFVAVAFSAYMDKHPKRKLPGVVWMYVALALYAYIFVLTVSDRGVAIVLRTQWLLLVIAALSTAQTVVDRKSGVRVVRALCFGLAPALVVVFASLPLQGRGAFASGLHRFEPWGTNSNQIAVLYALSFPLFMYMGLKRSLGIWKPICFGFASLAFGMALISQSRSSLAILLLGSLPLLKLLLQKPIFLAVGSVLGLIFVSIVIKQAGGNARFDRFSTLETGRFDIFMHYINDEISRRPVFGLLGTQNLSFFKGEGDEMHTHNAYLDHAYVGGLALFVPMFSLVLLSLISAFRLFRVRKTFRDSRLLLAVVVFVLVAFYAQGFANNVIYYPTYEVAFVHVLFSIFVLTWDRDIRKGTMPLTYDGYDSPQYAGDEGEIDVQDGIGGQGFAAA